MRLPASIERYLTPVEREIYILRMKDAWSKLPPDTQAQIKPLLDDAHDQLGDFVKTGKPPKHSAFDVLRVKSYLTNDWDGHTEQLDNSDKIATKPVLGPQGQILGLGKYEELDPMWGLVAGTVWLENLLHRHPFPPGEPKVVPIDDPVSIVLAGDFGTGNFGASDSPSTKMSKFVPSLKPDITIHLGDVYYAGTAEEGASNLIDLWPKGSKASFTLNSNHEMYSGGGPYFNKTVGGPVFNTPQSPFSFFALEHKSWIVVGLDSAYNAGALGLYMDGSLGKDAQIDFLAKIAQKANDLNKKVILLTHHNGLPDSGAQPTVPLKLYSEVMTAFNNLTPPAFWYWGHLHLGAVYKALPNGLRCRCIGHSALPWGFASVLQSSQNVEWFEKRSANDPSSPIRVKNGFVALKLNGSDISEIFYDEDGGIAWKSS
jgi:hypothetical protein